MTPEEYRLAIQLSEDRINLQLERDKRKLLCDLQSKNRTYVKNPGLVTYTFAYEELVKKAKAQMAQEAEAIEATFYGLLEEL